MDHTRSAGFFQRLGIHVGEHQHRAVTRILYNGTDEARRIKARGEGECFVKVVFHSAPVLRHSRESGNPCFAMPNGDARFRGHDRVDWVAGIGGLESSRNNLTLAP